MALSDEIISPIQLTTNRFVDFPRHVTVNVLPSITVSEYRFGCAPFGSNINSFGCFILLI